MQIESAGGVVINRHGQVIVVNQKGVTWSLPKGYVEKGEDLLTAARREIYEETGIKHIALVRELGAYGRHKVASDGSDDRTEFKTIHMFLFTTDQETLKPVDPDNPEARWVEKGKVAGLLSHRKDKEFFLSVIDKLG